MNFKTIFKSFKNKDMRKRIFAVVGILIVYRFLAHIPVSGVAAFFTGLPIVGNFIRLKALLHTVKKWNGFISLPNRTFKKNILSELWGNVNPAMIAERVKRDIDDTEGLKAVREELLKHSGNEGASVRLCDIATGTGDAL